MTVALEKYLLDIALLSPFTFHLTLKQPSNKTHNNTQSRTSFPEKEKATFFRCTITKEQEGQTKTEQASFSSSSWKLFFGKNGDPRQSLRCCGMASHLDDRFPTSHMFWNPAMGLQHKQWWGAVLGRGRHGRDLHFWRIKQQQ